jgi:molybdopterin/thiamine biosynthesis adenylyltransferase
MAELPRLSRDELLRYSRHVVLPDVGVDGQRRIKAARVLLVGAGGLGSPALLYLAAAGVGTLGIVDDDTVSLSNLQRQVIHGTPDVGHPKVESAANAIHRLNPNVNIGMHDIAAGEAVKNDPVVSFHDRTSASDLNGTETKKPRNCADRTAGAAIAK